MVLSFLGFCPERYNIRECCRELNELVDPVVTLSEHECLQALNRKLINPKFLRADRSVLSSILITTVCSKLKYGPTAMRFCEDMLRGRSYMKISDLSPT
jgi:hypothetical protein